ncbi:GAF domain-containing protein, partial [Candidatus Kryptonium thompsonii]
MNILVVDDNTEARKLLAELLTQSGFNVIEAENGKSALEILSTRKDFALIISDILMPVMDGFKFCHEVKSNPELSSIPFVFLTGSYISDEDKIFGIKLGADDFIIKPIQFDELLKRINDVIYKGRARKAHAEIKIDEFTYLAEYNARLVNKLEDKLLELGDAYDKIKKKSEELETINLILSALNSSRDIKHLFKQISKHIAKLFNADAVNFYIYNPNTNVLDLSFSFLKTGDENIFEKYKTLKFGDDFATEIINQKLMIYQNISKESTKVRSEILKHDFKIFVEVALRSRENFVGSIELAYKQDEAPFDENKISLLDTLSQQIAIGVENLLLISKLKESEEKYRTFVHLTPAGLVVLDENLNILFASEITNEIFETEIEGKNLREFIGSQIIDLVRANSSKTFEAKYKDKVLLISMTAKLDDLKFGKYIAVINDITEFRKLQDEKRKIELKLWQEYRLASIGRLAGGIAHNLRNPLTVINLGLQALKRKGFEQENIEKLIKQVERINQIVENLSIKTREEVEKNKKRFDLNELIRKELEVLEFDPFYKHKVEKNIQLCEKPIVIEAVYSHFSSAVSHILRNAIDA